MTRPPRRGRGPRSRLLGCCCWTQPTALGWVHERRIPAEGILGPALVEQASAILTPWMSLRDALSVMLDEQVITGVVVDADGRARGVVTVDQLAGALR
ncbi:MAG: hypothetical protein R3C32_02770 [Chloroflexota bacterium]